LQQLWALMMKKKMLRIGTRGSALAVWQADWVKSRLLTLHPGCEVELVKIKTTGDKILDVPLAQVGGKGLFVKEIETALLEGHVDLAVHSMKDMPAEVPPGLCIGAIPKRENPLDVLVSRNGKTFEALPQGAKVGSSSLRRGAQVRHRRPDISICGLRGNLGTRIKKLETEELDAIILAAAGITRLGLAEHITEYMPESIMLPAVGQGALSIEVREGDPAVQSCMDPLDDWETRATVETERAFLARLEGGCQVPIAGRAKLKGDTIEFTGLISEVDGSVMLRETISGPVADRQELGEQLAERLLDRGGREILAQVYGRSAQDVHV
jgi:hydroxymethylbilane synthase